MIKILLLYRCSKHWESLWWHWSACICPRSENSHSQSGSQRHRVCISGWTHSKSGSNCGIWDFQGFQQSGQQQDNHLYFSQTFHLPFKRQNRGHWWRKDRRDGNAWGVGSEKWPISENVGYASEVLCECVKEIGGRKAVFFFYICIITSR